MEKELPKQGVDSLQPLLNPIRFMRLSETLNLEQKDAASHMDGPLLVLAGAGSGKTRVVTYRIMHLLSEGVDPDQILGLTFTNKAAGEMKERVRALTSYRVWISTFHSLGVRILRESIHHLGYSSDFTVFDEEDVEKLLKDCLKSTPLKKKGDLKTLRSMISKAKHSLSSSDTMDTDGSNPEIEEIFPHVFSLYQKRLKENQAVDFDDLLALPVELFQKFPDVLEGYQDRFRYLLIDEYQDTNHAQYTLVQQLANKRKNLCVVGDPDQSIYSWRGATISNIMGFVRDYPEAKVIRLEQNYRSTETILDASNALITQNLERFEKNLWSDRGKGEEIQCYTASTDRNEADYVIEQVQKYRMEEIPLKEMVILYRTNFQSRIFEDYLLYNDIPYTIVGGVSFYQRREVKDVLAFLRMVQTDVDSIAFTRTINLPKRGFGKVALGKFLDVSQKEGIPLFELCQALVRGERAVPKLSVKQQKGLKQYVEIIEHLRSIAKSDQLPELIMAAIHETGYLDVLREDAESFLDRRGNIEELISKAASWVEENLDQSLSTFLTELVLKSSLDESPSDEDHLTLMTIHNGKGLEYQVAFMVGMEEDLFPHIHSKELPEQLEEERRLCYVGMTRAKDHLHMSRATCRFLWGGLRTMRKSRFLDEIPEDYCSFH